VEVEMQFLPPVQMVCDTCAGKGFKADVLKVRFKSRNIREMLGLSVNECLEEVGSELPAKEKNILVNIKESGLGYIKLGQRLKTLSVGELQRVKLVKYLNRKKSGALFLIDEPSFGLHDYDIRMVKQLICKIVTNKNTVVAAEHHMGLISSADYIIELGPGGGERGGELIFQGSTAATAEASKSITGIYLKKNKKRA
jgi:excinuclease ABC subunit A